jgi:glycosyltransferase involved in cell wall biosynthesis
MAIKIAFGTTLLDKGLTESGIDGIGHYCQELLKQYSNQDGNLAISPYSFGVKRSSCGAQLLPTYLDYLAKSILNLSGAQQAKKYFNSVDVIHSTDQLIPIVSKKPLIATVMDVIPLSHSHFIRSKSRFIKPFLWKKLTQRANHIITISHFSKSEIVNAIGYPEENITSIPLGVDARYFERLSSGEVQKCLDALKITRPFFLFIGSIQPRKNLGRILRAHASLPNNLAKEFPVVIAGKLAWDDGETLHEIQKGIAEKRCIWANYVNDLEKRCLLQASVGMVFTSLYEGFGLPILEAFASQTPVLTSNCTSMPEVAGGSAILADPLDIASIRDGLLELLNNQTKVQDLKIGGFQRAKLFSWDRVASDTQKVYRSLL